MKNNRLLIFFLAFIVFIGIYFIPFGLEHQAKATIAIAVLAMILWISEVIPLHVTAIIVALLLIAFGKFPADRIFAQFFDKVVVLVLGGFILAVAMRKHKLDEYLAHKLLGKFNSSAKMILLGMILVTAFLSMWISNSAAAALTIPIALVVLHDNKLYPLKSNFGKSMVLAVAYGSTIGGIGTLIGSTPNVITQKFLSENGVSFGFLEWFVRGFPFMIIMIFVCWIILYYLFKPEKNKLKMKRYDLIFTSQQKKVISILIITILLWITEFIHGIHSSVIALVPIALLYIFNLLDEKDFNKVDWNALILIGGGIALGMAIDISGLDDIFSSFLGNFMKNQPYFFVLLILGIIGVFMTSFLSNTAASSVIIPIITSLAVLLKVDMTNLVVASAIGVSLDFIFPMGTPPSALAHSTGYIRVKDMIKSGVAISIAGIIVLAIMGYFTW
ncbi:DASS family sodium-coupled anion symporter [Candidatus Woesearchaeota archaeon]|nr:DASS family sodium-coupled anion symporter [Candidatus Woesearchaeota archaeon]